MARRRKRRLRKVTSLTQDEVAEKAGLSRVGYRSIENRKSMPRASTREALAEALGVGLQELGAASRVAHRKLPRRGRHS